MRLNKNLKKYALINLGVLALAMPANASDFTAKYNDWKQMLSEKYGIDYSMNVSYMMQRGAPNGKHTSYQAIAFPIVHIKTFENEYGKGTLHVAYRGVRYNGVSERRLKNNLGVVTNFNDFTRDANYFNKMYFEYQLPGKADWLSISLGQYSLYDFDGTAYNYNQQTQFVNWSHTQSATLTHPSASFGSFATIKPNDEFKFAFGLQDASNVTGESMRFRDLHEGHYTTFGYAAWTPEVKNLGKSQVSLMLYNQPGVREAPGTSNGWALNLSQDLGEKFAVFGGYNGITNHVFPIKTSYVVGGVYKNPFERNDLDRLGVAFSYNKIDGQVLGVKPESKHEKIAEAYYDFGISQWLIITPDIQYYMDPALNTKSDNATVFSLRATLMF